MLHIIDGLRGTKMVLTLPRLISIFRLWLCLVAEQLLILPISIVFYNLVGISNPLLFIASYLFINLLAMIARDLLPRAARPYILIIGIICSTLLCLYTSQALLFRVLAPLILSAVIWHGMNMIETGSPGAAFPSFILLGFIFYPLAAWVFSRSTRFLDLLPMLSVAGTLALSLSLALVSRQHIRDSGRVLERKLHLPTSLMRKNALYLCVFIAALLIGTAWEILGRTILYLMSSALRIIGEIFALIGRFMQGSGTRGNDAVQLPIEQLLPGNEDSSALAEILQTIVMILIGLAILLLAIRGLYKLSKLIIPYLKLAVIYIIELLRRYFLGQTRSSSGDPGFVDEVESLLNKNETALSAAKKWLLDRMGHEAGYSTMKSNNERVRWIYRRLVRREIRHGMEFIASCTPFELLLRFNSHKKAKAQFDADEAAKIYSFVRYTGEEPSDLILAEMKKACD